MSSTPRTIVEEVLGKAMAREIWSGNYERVLPISLSPFELPAVFPAIFYMFRFGHRRGKGNFLDVFGDKTGTQKERRGAATIERVANTLAADNHFADFEGAVEQAILGDLLLSFCLENSRRALGRQVQVQRVASVHYMASWIDLPESVSHLRFVPEMIVAMLADQELEYVEQNQSDDQTWFSVGRGFEENVLLKAFNQGVVRDGNLGDYASDRFHEDTEVGLDQLLMIRLAQRMRAAPFKLRGGEGERISNQRPISELAARNFSEDIRRFVRNYAVAMPRHTFVELLESCMALGLTTILTSAMEILFEWSETGEIPESKDQQPVPLFADCSNGVVRPLHSLAEQSMDDFMRLTEHFPVVLMALRLLDYGARYDRRLKRLEISTHPYATEWINLLGEVLHERIPEAGAVLDNIDRQAEQLAEALAGEYPEAAEIISSDQVEPNPVWRLSAALTYLQGGSNTHKNLLGLLDSVLLVSQPNGLAVKRTVTRKIERGGRSTRRELRSIVLSDAVLDYLVHLHVLPAGNRNGHRALSFRQFLQTLRDRYGLCVDEAPPGMTISNEHLQQNRRILERRLRDLGLLVGVNDAEAMKRLQPRFAREEQEEQTDVEAN